MAQSSSIEWTEATWNPVTGCTKISLGCDNCYAEPFFFKRWGGKRKNLAGRELEGQTWDQMPALAAA